MSTDEIFDYVKDMPWWGWALGGGVVLAGFYFGTRDPEPVPVANISQADEGAERRPSGQQKLSEAEMVGKLTEMKNAFQEQQQEQAENFATILDRQGERFSQLDEQWSEKVSALTSSYQEKVSTLENQVRDVESQVQNERDQEPQGTRYHGNNDEDDSKEWDDLSDQKQDFLRKSVELGYDGKYADLVPNGG